MNTEEELKEKLFEVMKKYHQVTNEQSFLERRLAELKTDKDRVQAERVSIERSLNNYFRTLDEDNHSR